MVHESRIRREKQYTNSEWVARKRLHDPNYNVYAANVDMTSQGLGHRDLLVAHNLEQFLAEHIVKAHNESFERTRDVSDADSFEMGEQ